MSSDGDSFVEDAPESSEWRPSRSSEPKRSKNFKMASAYGSVATSQDSGAKRGQHFDPWDQLRIQHAAGDMEALVESRKRAAKQRAATNLFHATIRSKAHPLIRHCRRIMREQLRKREGVMRTEGIKITATAIEYGWVPDIIVCGPRQAVQLLKQVPTLKKEDLTIATEDVVESVLLQPRLDPLLAVGAIPNRPRPHKPKRAMLLGVQDPTNLGSLLRTGAALGITSVFLMPGCPDPYNPAVIRTSAGACLLMEYGTEEDALASDLPVICADANDDGHSAYDTKSLAVTQDRFLLALGHESRGLPESWLERGHVLTLPLHIESLGVAVAGAIILDRLLGERLDPGT